MNQYKNIKDSIFAKASMDKQISKFKNVIFPALRSLGVGGIFTFLFLNLIFSQFISSIYFGFINNDKKSTINFLQKIKALSEYSRVLEMNNNIYGNVIKTEITKQENKKKVVINNLEAQLTINPRARDVLYSLYQLYITEGNKSKAEEYLTRAKEVDPSLR